MISNEKIRQLVEYALLEIVPDSSIGLYQGKAGFSLTFFELARYLQDEELEDRAFNLLQESILRATDDYSFENGLSGIGYAILYLIANKFIDADFDEIFGNRFNRIIEKLECIDERPQELLDSVKMIYFLSPIMRLKKGDGRIKLIIEKLFRGFELYLSIQFFDFKNIHYINNKSVVLRNYETYLKLVDYADFNDLSGSLLDDYAELYRSGRIMSSLFIGYYLDKIQFKYNIEKYEDVVMDNVKNSFDYIHMDLLTLGELVDFVKLINNTELNSIDCRKSPWTKLAEEALERKVLRMFQAQSPSWGYQNGISRYLIHSVNPEVCLL